MIGGSKTLEGYMEKVKLKERAEIEKIPGFLNDFMYDEQNRLCSKKLFIQAGKTVAIETRRKNFVVMKSYGGKEFLQNKYISSINAEIIDRAEEKEKMIKEEEEKLQKALIAVRGFESGVRAIQNRHRHNYIDIDTTIANDYRDESIVSREELKQGKKYSNFYGYYAEVLFNNNERLSLNTIILCDHPSSYNEIIIDLINSLPEELKELFLKIKNMHEKHMFNKGLNYYLNRSSGFYKS
jgi:hypothetical protein